MPASPAPILAAPVALPDPLAVVGALAGKRQPFALLSGGGGPQAAWSFFGAEPFETFRGEDPARLAARFRELAAALAAEGGTLPPAAAAAPFTGGAVGYWAYDYGRRLERLPARAADDLGLPDHVVGLYDVVVAREEASGSAWVFSSGLPLAGAPRERRARERAREAAAWIEDLPRRAAAGGPPAERSAGAEAVSTFGPAAYRRGVETVIDHIRRGDIFQANLSQRWTVALDPADPAARAAALAAALARRSPAPFSAFLGAGDHALAGASPERFLELRGGRVETRPVKGTRPRGATAAEDARLARELAASAKDRAENVMIVDVLRNDLGRVCAPGTVETRALCALEAFPQVFHLVSTVRGELRPGLDAFDLFAACFPGGSITGAPKIRAMEILDALEPVRRHAYTGSLGYLDWGGDADWSILIRTALVTPSAVRFAAGGGITADSDPAAEYQETLDKAEGLRAALADRVGPLSLEPGRAGARR